MGSGMLDCFSSIGLLCADARCQCVGTVRMTSFTPVTLETKILYHGEQEKGSVK